jgi:hypothetical protein
MIGSKCMKYALPLLTLFWLVQPCSATTWDEPWQETVIREADSFVLLEVLSNNRKKSFTARIDAHLAGEKPERPVTVDGFYCLDLRSYSSGHPPRLFFKKGYRGYFFLKIGPEGKNYRIATPTAGWATMNDGSVTAAYRHTYHKALVEKDLYEKTMTAIFKHLHGEKHDRRYIRGLFQKYLTQKPSDIDPKDYKGEASTLFFRQHVALECFVYFGKEADIKLLEPFLNADGYHVQISAARALGGLNSKAALERLMAFIEADRTAFAKVMAVWGLKRLGARDQAERLKKYLADGKDEKCGFGGNLMDPRVSTRFPSSVKRAIQGLLREWETKEQKGGNKKKRDEQGGRQKGEPSD